MSNEVPEKKPGFGRFVIFLIFTGVLVLVILAQYISLMLVNHQKKSPPQLSNPMVERGPILDRNGRILAIQTKLDSVTAWIPNIENPKETATILGRVLNLDPAVLEKEIEERTGFMYVKRKISSEESRQIAEAKESGKLAGISLEPEYGRNYPEKDIASQVLGYVGTDNIGLAGVEYALNQVLSPEPGKDSTEIVYGNQIFLTLDLNIQYMTEKIAKNIMEEHDPDYVTILVVDAKIGEFLSYASLPSFDPNAFNKFGEFVRKNRPATYAYEPGSVFKVFSVASFLELGGIDYNNYFYCDGYYELDYPNGQKERIKCLGSHGSVNAQKIIQYSCNAGAAYASETVDEHSLYQMLRLFGFGEPTGLPCPGESFGLINDPESWSLRSKATIAFGQELSVSAVQIAAAATVFANDGFLLKPHLIKKIVDPEGKVLSESAREPLRQVLSPGTAKYMLGIMETATAEEGTATRAAIDGVRISAKTGTAQMLDRKTGTYSENAFVASCLAIFPTDDPRVICYVVIDNPKKGETYGGRIAAPIIHDLALELIPYLKIPREGEMVVGHEGYLTVKKTEPLSLGDTMPDLTGLSKRQIMSLFYQKNLTFTIRGNGWVAKQEPAPGTPLTENTRIILELE